MKVSITKLMLLSIMCTSCCSMTANRTEIVTVNSSPPGADITINGYSCGMTPQAFEMDVRYSHTIVLEKANFQTQQYYLKSKTRGIKLLGNAISPIVGCGAGALIGYAAAGFTTSGFLVLVPILGGACGLGIGSTIGIFGTGLDLYKGAAKELCTDTVDIKLQPVE